MTRKQVIVNAISVAQNCIKDLLRDKKLNTEKVLRDQGYFKHTFEHLERMLDRNGELRTKDETLARAIVGFESDCNELFHAVKKDYKDNPENGTAEHNYTMMRRWMNYEAYKAKAFADVFLSY